MIIGIVIPAYNEEEYLSACLNAIKKAIQVVNESLIEVKILVVLDSCTDQSLTIVKNANIDYLQCSFKCVGKARDLGVRHLITTGADWIACTDADSCVDKNWLFQQLSHQPADAICGVVEIDHWHHLSAYTKQNYLNHYQDQMGHHHIHGANLSFSATAYIACGGFNDMTCHEDISLIQRMQNLYLNIIWSNKVRVSTSSRLISRVPEGFANFLKNLESNHIPSELNIET